MTVAELRRKAFERYCEEQGLDREQRIQLRTLVISYYRLCGLEERVFHWTNDCDLWNRGFVQRAQDRADKWCDSLVERFSKFGLTLVYFGYLPTICYKGTTRTAIDKYFY